MHDRTSCSRTAAKIVWDQVHLLVVDDGKGMAVVPNGHFCETPRAGVGIPGMKARLRRLGGDLKILSGTGGTKLHGVIPVRAKKQCRQRNSRGALPTLAIEDLAAFA